MPAMIPDELTTIGRAGLKVPRSGFGTAPLATAPAWGSGEPIAEAQALAALEFAYTKGIRFFDTAPNYVRGLAERRTGLLLKQVPRESVIVATKVGFDITGAETRRDYSRDGVLRSLEGSLSRLHVDYVDIVHVHDPDDHYEEVLDHTFPTLDMLRQQGVIKAVGAGMNQWQMLMQFARQADFDCLMIAGRYTLLDQSALPLLDYCQARGIAIFAASIYNSGILATGASAAARPTYNHGPAPDDIIARVQKIEAICRQSGLSLHTLATQFPLAHPAVSTLIVGFQHPAEVQAYLDAVAQQVPPGVWTRLLKDQLLIAETRVPTKDT
jgi:D-threo-aldose 1-dehydrogenase